MLRARSVTLGYSQFVLVLGVTLLLAASAGASSEYNPEVAVEEVGRLFNLLFPLVLPDKMPYSWPRGTAAASSVDASDAALAQVAAGGGYGGQRRNPDDPASRASSLNLPKRGESECLSRCMSQRKLHPIQCLNIC
ncbi:uncharacterized protein LOC119393536 isoform X2 [Rhipicephalus sanguineus]|uniref:uncharacterized protein LOC119393536 isoform X2 n=1 Tax=Rhipicephalus sanguineus TaxID=34632 RepID=UPI001894147F|nr:uncharacterized protein LOC119393536 isoform X2 [Rhipicephalus sanguineus]